MYAWIDDESWAADGQPELTEWHGMMANLDQVQPRIYGRILAQDEVRVVAAALVNKRFYGTDVPIPQLADQ